METYTCANLYSKRASLFMYLPQHYVLSFKNIPASLIDEKCYGIGIFSFSSVNFEEHSSAEMPTRRMLDPDCLMTDSDETSIRVSLVTHPSPCCTASPVKTFLHLLLTQEFWAPDSHCKWSSRRI